MLGVAEEKASRIEVIQRYGEKKLTKSKK